MIIVVCSATAILGQEGALRALSLAHVRRSRTEPGCIAHDVTTDCENSSRFVFVEYWRDMPALMDHFALDDSKAFVRALRPLLSEDPDMKIFHSEPVPI